MRHIGHVIGGKAIEGASGRTSPVFNPATGEQTAVVGLASDREVDDAVEAARKAHADWSRVSLARRAEILFAFREQLHRRSDELAAVITAEHGKVHSDALGEVARGLEN